MQARLETLPGDDLRFAFGRVPLRLARRLDVAGHDASDTDGIRAVLARERPGHAFDAGLCGFVDDEILDAEVPRDRTHVDDRAATALLHAGRHGLRAEELVAQIHRHAIVPVDRKSV